MGVYNVFEDLTGNIFGRLTVIKRLPNVNKRVKWLCICVCGNESEVAAGNLKNGHIQSCGCYHIERSIEANIKHGQSSRSGWTKEYSTWASMLERCYNSNTKSYKYYGAEGIIVCERWRHSFQNFFDDMGTKPSLTHTIDRIDSKGNYEPDNCRWATRKQQNDNTRRNKWMKYLGMNMVISDWARFFGVSQSTMWKNAQKKTIEEIYNFYKQKGKINNENHFTLPHNI